MADSVLVEDEEPKEFIGDPDTAQVSHRQFDRAIIDSLKNNPDFDYKQPPTVAETLWDRFLRWLSEFWQSLFSNAVGTDIGRFFLYGAGIILLSILIMMLLKVNGFKVFYSGSDVGARSSFFEENIHEMDFEQLIKNATDQQDFRQATRLVLLFALKMLSDKQMIQWQAGKTNHDYVNELAAGEIKTGLNELSFYFDYAWYGNFSINAQTYQRVENSFADWRQKINKAK